MCNAADNARQLCIRKMREQEHVIAKSCTDVTVGVVDRFEHNQRCALARARHQAYAEVLEELQ